MIPRNLRPELDALDTRLANAHDYDSPLNVIRDVVRELIRIVEQALPMDVSNDD